MPCESAPWAGFGSAAGSGGGVLGAAAAGATGALPTAAFASLQAPAGVAPAHLGALGSGFGAALPGLGATAGAADEVPGTREGGGGAAAHEHSAALEELRASQVSRPSPTYGEEGMRKSGRVVPHAVLFAVEAQHCALRVDQC